MHVQSGYRLLKLGRHHTLLGNLQNIIHERAASAPNTRDGRDYYSLPRSRGGKSY